MRLVLLLPPVGNHTPMKATAQQQALPRSGIQHSLLAPIAGSVEGKSKDMGWSDVSVGVFHTDLSVRRLPGASVCYSQAILPSKLESAMAKACTAHRG